MSPRELFLEMHPDDVASRGLEPGSMVEVASRRGSLKARLVCTPNLAKGVVFLPMHDRRVNVLTFPSFDPYSREPSYKHAAVRVGRG
jgi:assimilatory nitrate reductase catalytic subunit